MSNITLQFGQCGNQIGQALYDCIYEDILSKSECNKSTNNEYVCESTNLWFNKNRDGLEARSLLVDTEEKVTHLAAHRKPYKFKNIISGSYGGSGNNWAFGYTSRSLLVAKEVMEKLRREVEKCDFFTTILNILSSSGGTGSGVGTKIIELIRNEYPSKFMTNIIILPFEKGDVITQNYNTVLSLAKLYDNADNTIVFQNDKIFEISRKVLPKKEIELTDLNKIIAQQLISVLQPIKVNNTWTQVEKVHLLEALRKYGASDIERISGDLPYKSFCDVRTIISKYQTLAVRSLTEGSSSTTAAGAPIDMWINLMKQILTRDNNNVISRLLKYIALFESREKGSVNLEDCYMVLSDLTNGHPSKELDDKTAAFFFGCLTKLAKSVKEGNDDKEETYLDSLEFNKLSATKTYRSKADNNVLISDVNLNPCRVPANLLVDKEK